MFDDSTIGLRPTAKEQMLVWARLGVQSFGGGTATLSLIRRAAVDEEHWISEEEFARFWGLVQMAPGINLVGLTILVGQAVGGAIGIPIALSGLLLPSAAITVLLTAFYAHIQHLHIVVSALSGVIPATVGVGIVTGCQIAFPILRNKLGKGRRAFAVGLCLFVGSGAVFALVRWPVVTILLLAGAIGAVTQYALSSNRKVETR